MASFRDKKKNRVDAAAAADAWNDSFLPTEAVPYIQAMVKLLQSGGLEEKVVRKLLSLAVQQIEGKTLSKEVQDGISSDSSLSILFDGLYNLLHEAIRLEVPVKILVDDLTSVQVPKAVVDDIAKVMKNKQTQLSEANASPPCSIPSIVDVCWRIDVAISTTSLSRAFKPSLLLQLTLSDGVIKTFECNVETFHALRYNTARALKSLIDLSEHPTIVRIDQIKA